MLNHRTLVALCAALTMATAANAQPKVPAPALSEVLPTVDDLKVGTFVQVEGLFEGDHILADQFEVFAEPLDEETLEAEIQAVDAIAMTFTLMGLEVMVMDDTKVRADPDRAPLDFLDLEVGDRVKAKGVMGEDRTMIARKVKRREPDLSATADPANSIKLEGMIEEANLEEGTVVVHGITVRFGEVMKFKIGT